MHTPTADPRQAELTGYTTRRLRTEEFPLVNALYNRAYRTERSEEEADWLYKQHPYGEAIVLAAFSDTQLAGVLPAMAHRFVWGGREQLAYQLIDAVVAPEHRNRGIFGNLVNKLCRKAADENFIVFAFPNDQSMSVYRKTGLMQSVGAFEVRARVLSWSAYLRYRLRGETSDATPAPAAATRVLRDRSLSLVPVPRVASGFEDVHERLQTAVASFTLRRPEFLNWRYFGSPERRYQVALLQRSSQTVGYVAVRMTGRIVHVMDMFVDPDPRTIRSAVRLLSRWARRMGAMAVYFSASRNHFAERALIRSGYLLKKKGGEIAIDPAAVDRLAASRRNPPATSDFYFVWGDGDFY